jgi:hypothetical protein
MHKSGKILLIVPGSIIILLVIVILLSSPIIKYLVTKYDEKFTGRRVTMDWAYANPLTGYIFLSNLKIYEQNSDSVFFSSDGTSVNIAMLKLFSKTYEISKLTLTHPHGTIIQNNKDFNFDDLIDRFSSKENSDSSISNVHFNILKIKIIDGEFYYREQLIPINYFIKKVNFISDGKMWDADTISTKFSFLPGTGSGEIKGEFTLNLKNLDYRIAFITHKFDLSIIDQYLKDLTNKGTFSAYLDANIKAKGNLNDQENLNASGQIEFNDLHIGKNPKNDLFSFKKMAIGIKELDPRNHKYLFDTILLSKPYIKYELYDNLDNMETMFGKNGSKIEKANADIGKFNLIIEIARYIKVLANSFFQSDYKINSLRISDGDIKFNDFSISEKFSVALNPLNVVADSINKDLKRVKVTLESNIKPYGAVSIYVSMNPKDSSDFDLQYRFQKLPAAMFNPYTISYTSFPLDRGTLELNGVWNVRNGMIHSKNHLLIIDPRTTKRIRNKDLKWVPAPLIMSFIRERGNIIDYEIPISGNLKNPKFHLRDIIFDFLGNVFTKPATFPYRFQVKNAETEIEKSLTLSWKMRYGSLSPAQEKFTDKIAVFMSKNPKVIITVNPQQYSIKEKEYIMFFEAKKKYLLTINNNNAQRLNEADSAKVENMSIKDSSFVHYLNMKTNDSTIFTIQEKCLRIIDTTTVNSKYEQLNKEREIAFILNFKKREVENRVQMSKAKNIIPYNGFSFYKIEYNGDFPAFLIKAYKQMNEFNDEAPRKKFKQERESENTKSLVSK